MGDSMKVLSSVRTLDVEWADGRKKTYHIDVSNKERLTKWLGQEVSLDKLKGITDKSVNEQTLDEMYDVCKDLVSNMVGDKEAKDMLKRSNGSLFVLLQLIAKMGTMASAALAEAQSVVESITKQR